jgi:histidinol phosphatase-like enzyme (inositol monophosphatase family)
VDDLDDLVATAEAAADAAGRVLRPYFRSGLGADLKGDQSPVTVADRAAEQAMRAVFDMRTPGFGVLGEEFGLERGEAGRRWVVDPIDGTRAFLTGRPVFGTLVALLDGDTPILGVIDQPITGERWVGAGGRTLFRGPLGGRAGTRRCAALANAELSCTAPEIFTSGDHAGFARLQSATARTSWGGDCYGYGLLALGQIDVIAEATLKLWDWAALLPVIEGAGGRMTGWHGETLCPGCDGRVLAVGDPALLDVAVRVLDGRAAVEEGEAGLCPNPPAWGFWKPIP